MMIGKSEDFKSVLCICLAFGKVKYERDDKCVVKDFRDLGYNIRLAQGQKRLNKNSTSCEGKKERVSQKCALKSIE